MGLHERRDQSRRGEPARVDGPGKRRHRAWGGGIWFTEKDASFTTATIVGADDKTDDKLKDIKPDNKSKEDKTEDKKEGKPGDKAKPKKPIALPGSIFRALWVGLRKMFFSGILFAPTRSPLSEPGE